MKKIYTLIVFALTATTMQAQLVLTHADIDNVVGDMEITQSYDSVQALPRNTGQNQLWDFSAIVTNTNAPDTNFYVSPASVPASSLFPGTTVVEVVAPQDYVFYKNTSAESEELGYDDVNAFGTYSNTLVESVWPVAYGYSNTDTYSGNLTGQASGTREGTITVSAIGTGTVIMPGGIHYTNVLQIKSIITDIQLSSAGNLTLITSGYGFYRAGEKSSFVTVATASLSYANGTLTNNFSATGVATAHTTNTSTATGIIEQAKNFDFSVFPNPASSSVNVVLSNPSSENCMIEIYNTVGSVVKQVNAGNGASIKTQINTSDLNAGIYFVKTIAGNVSSVKKVVIQ